MMIDCEHKLSLTRQAKRWGSAETLSIIIPVLYP